MTREEKEGRMTVKEFPDRIFSVSTPRWMKREKKGGAIMQTWVAEGNKYVMAVDTPAPEEPGLKTFIEDTFGKPVIMVCTHGHIDHIGCCGQFGKVYMAQADWALAAGGGIVPSDDPKKLQALPYHLENLKEGQDISLGNRNFRVLCLPGHTRGSIVLYEEKTGILFGGDSVARRILYGLSDWTPPERYLSGLRKISRLKTEAVYSAHDDFALPGDMADRIIQNIESGLDKSERLWKSPVDGRVFKRILTDTGEESPEFFDFVIPAEKCVHR